jgi:hypothetical protein
VAAVGRPSGPVLIRWVTGESQGRSGTDELYINIEIVPVLAIPGERHLLAIGGEGREKLPARKTGQRNGFWQLVRRRVKELKGHYSQQGETERHKHEEWPGYNVLALALCGFLNSGCRGPANETFHRGNKPVALAWKGFDKTGIVRGIV